MEKKKVIFLIIIFSIIALLIGYSIGYTAGVSWALNWGVEKALAFADKQGIEIKLNKEMIATALWQYKETINSCLFTQNASLYNDKGN